jgi:hypothetical protein
MHLCCRSLLYNRNIMTSMCPISIKSQGGSVTNYNVSRTVSMMSPISPANDEVCTAHVGSLAARSPPPARNIVDDSRSLSRIVSDQLSQWQLVKASV